ncbi:DeoR family transcriptional regulator [Gallibacterium salpingitidis]|uniref:DeoR family transcriptional regulator n=1 Tax=Gallibacterium salpingitidis TaxID=505341 RepID=A0AB36E4H9_9PAST|nr:DeoR/GlpR family DNA-binding transcription regulator [Gallibacterium salpingitidis]OBX11326.1 DeoR family transcriptional regulator [Gallibacterium salpingitidis]WKS99236.1 DeoR/GlpR family DNA-binding transcription regulator [Gallibacterium salpingitidis]
MKDRHSLILEVLNQKGKIQINELVKLLNVSVETVRRDLSFLSQQQLLYRTHGGALSKKTDDIGSSFQRRQKTNAEVKRIIAERVAEYIYEGVVIGLDASTTSWYVAQLIPNIPCSVVTNSMHNITALVNKPNVKTIATGGVYSGKYDAFYGPLSEYLLSRLHIDIGIFSCIGVDDNGAIWESNELNVAIKRKMMDVSSQKFLLVDPSKFGKQNLVQLAEISQIDMLFTQGNIPERLLKYCDKNGVTVFG